MKQDEGYYSYQGPEIAVGGNTFRDGFYVCGHCEQGMLKSAYLKAGGLCFVCDTKICINCLGRLHKFGCESVQRTLEKAINEHYHREQNAKILGI